ncbi:MAG: hypothetical protein ABIE42_01535 [Candidatus Eisenbacteria bacterium]
MRSVVERRPKHLLVACTAVLAVCISVHLVWAADPILAIRLGGGQGRSYGMEDVERITFDVGTIHVITPEETDDYRAWSSERIEFLWDEWTGISEPDTGADVPGIPHLRQNRPNPFSPETWISFELPQAGRTELMVYTASGRLVRTLLDEECMVGPNAVLWDGRDGSGRDVASGVYFCALEAPGVKESRKMILLR